MATRRDFLKSSTLLGFGATVPTFLGRAARAVEKLTDNILVVIQLTGGNDGLNTVIPFTDPLYAKHRPTIAVPKEKVFKLSNTIGLHPALSAFGRLVNDHAAAAVIQGVGYPNPDQSHFRSMDIWQAASTEKTLVNGWLGQALRAQPMPAFHLAADNEAAPLALAGASTRVPSLSSLEDFQLKFGAANTADKSQQKKLLEDVSKAPGGGLLDFVQRTAADTYATTDKLAAIGRNYDPKGPYPATGLGNRLRLAAQLIDAGIGARLFYLTHDGFDTHSGQGGIGGTHANLLTNLGDSISAFIRDLKDRGHGDRVLVMTFSEFGRRAKENGSAGTDHGSAAPMLLAGGKVKAGVHGEHPSLEKLDDGNLVHAFDFRRVYASVLEQWLKMDSKKLLGGVYEPMKIIA